MIFFSSSSLFSRIQNAIAPVRSLPPTRAPSQIIRQHLFLPQPIAGDTSSTDPVSSDETGMTDLYHNAPVLKQLIPTRKNNHISGNQQHQRQHHHRSSVVKSGGGDKREYIDIPLPKSILQINLQSHDAKCARYNNEYIMPSKNNIIKHYRNNNNNNPHASNSSSNECSCKTSTTDDNNKHDMSSNNR